MSTQKPASDLQQPPANEQGPGKPGDLLVIGAHGLAGHELVAEIIGVIGTGEHTHYRVRWDDDHESIHFPGPDATIRRARTHRQP